MHRPLNPTDPTFGSATIEGSLSAQLNGDGEEDRPPDVVSRSGEESRAKVISGAIIKEGLWHNWMATTSGQWALLKSGGGGTLFKGGDGYPLHLTLSLPSPYPLPTLSLPSPYPLLALPLWVHCITLSNTQLEDMFAKIGCRQSNNNSGPIKQEAWSLHPLPVILTSTAIFMLP